MPSLEEAVSQFCAYSAAPDDNDEHGNISPYEG
jgi:hypothetical protein